MQIRIGILSILMPIQIRVLPLVLYMLENQKHLFLTFVYIIDSLCCLIYLISVIGDKFSIFWTLYWMVFWEKVMFSITFSWNRYGSGSGCPGCRSGSAKMMLIRPDPEYCLNFVVGQDGTVLPLESTVLSQFCASFLKICQSIHCLSKDLVDAVYSHTTYDIMFAVHCTLYSFSHPVFRISNLVSCITYLRSLYLFSHFISTEYDKTPSL